MDTKRAEDVARDGFEAVRASLDMAEAAAGVFRVVGMVKVAGTLALVGAVVAPLGLVLAVVLVPLWPWVFVLPALLVVLAVAAAVLGAFLAGKVFPERVRRLLSKVEETRERARVVLARLSAGSGGAVQGVSR